MEGPYKAIIEVYSARCVIHPFLIKEFLLIFKTKVDFMLINTITKSLMFLLCF